LRDAAAKAVAEEDVWGEFGLEKIPAERVIRHLYHVDTNRWSTDETIVKFEKTPFTHGAMRFCHRMKKLSTPPQSANNHRFHSYGWSRASNYVAKVRTIHYKEVFQSIIDRKTGNEAAKPSEAFLHFTSNHIIVRNVNQAPLSYDILFGTSFRLTALSLSM
jgi:hypothetical protein